MLTIVLWSIKSRSMHIRLSSIISWATIHLLLLLLFRSEKSIIKTLQSQQKQFMAEERRRVERNESILLTLERIDYQATSLAAKTDRLRALKVRSCNMKNSHFMDFKILFITLRRAEAIRKIFIKLVESETTRDLSVGESQHN